MLHTVLALVQDKRRFNIIVVSLAFALGCFTSTCVAQSTTVRIRFADGKSGKPLHLKYYDQGTGAVAAGNYKVDNVDGDSLIVTFNNVSTIAFRSDAYEPCDAKGKHAPRPQYSLQDIVDHGVVSSNYCGHAHAQPALGELLIYSRRDHWWEVSKNVLTGLLVCG
jgi:hypothetical protein